MKKNFINRFEKRDRPEDKVRRAPEALLVRNNLTSSLNKISRDYKRVKFDKETKFSLVKNS